MTLPLPGNSISAQQINTELALSNVSKTPTSTLSLNAADARALAAVPSGEIAYSDFYGKSAQPATASVNWNTGSIVSGNSASFTATFSRSTNYSWTVSGAGATPSSGSGGPATSFTQSISFPSPNSGTATVSVTPTGGTAATASLSVNAPAPPGVDYVNILLISGGGGGGGGGPMGDANSGGGGGGGSAGRLFLNANLQYNYPYSISIGYGGAGGQVGYTGTNGDASSIGPGWRYAFGGAPGSSMTVWGGGGGGGGIGGSGTGQQPNVVRTDGWSVPGGGSEGGGGGGAGGGNITFAYPYNSGGTGANSWSYNYGSNGGYAGGPGRGGAGGGGWWAGGGRYERGESTLPANTEIPGSGGVTSTGNVEWANASSTIYGGQGAPCSGDRSFSPGPSGSGLYYTEGGLDWSFLVDAVNTPDGRADTGNSFAGGGGGGTGDISTNAPGGVNYSWNYSPFYGNADIGWQSRSGTATDRNARDGYGHGGGGGNIGSAGGQGSNGSARIKWANSNGFGYFTVTSFNPDVPGTPADIKRGRAPFDSSSDVIIFHVPGNYTFMITEFANITTAGWSPATINATQSSSFNFTFDQLNQSYEWQVTGPISYNGAGTAANGMGTSGSLLFNTQGTYTATLTPTLGLRRGPSITRTLTVNAAPPPPPTTTRGSIQVIGGGGGGGAGSLSPNTNGGGGGGGAAYRNQNDGGTESDLLVGNNLTIQVGQGGDGGVSEGNGQNGTQSFVNVGTAAGGITVISQGGGGGGGPRQISNLVQCGNVDNDGSGGGGGGGGSSSPSGRAGGLCPSPFANNGGTGGRGPRGGGGGTSQSRRGQDTTDLAVAWEPSGGGPTSQYGGQGGETRNLWDDRMAPVDNTPENNPFYPYPDTRSLGAGGGGGGGAVGNIYNAPGGWGPSYQAYDPFPNTITLQASWQSTTLNNSDPDNLNARNGFGHGGRGGGVGQNGGRGSDGSVRILLTDGGYITNGGGFDFISASWPNGTPKTSGYLLNANSTGIGPLFNNKVSIFWEPGTYNVRLRGNIPF